MRCPRCTASLEPQGRTREPKGYRGEPALVRWHCPACDVWAHAGERLPALVDSEARRHVSRPPGSTRCPSCPRHPVLERLVISTSDRTADVEQCPGCRLLVVDGWEREAVEAVLASLGHGLE